MPDTLQEELSAVQTRIDQRLNEIYVGVVGENESDPAKRSRLEVKFCRLLMSDPTLQALEAQRYAIMQKMIDAEHPEIGLQAELIKRYEATVRAYQIPCKRLVKVLGRLPIALEARLAALLKSALYNGLRLWAGY
jgi:hypothetical protein